MRAIILAMAFAAAFAGQASAESGKTTMQHVRNHHRAANAQASVAAPDPFAVYANGHLIGRDPDPNVRSALTDEYWQRLIN